MASVVFEKQLANINKGLQSLRSMNKELNKFEKEKQKQNANTQENALNKKGLER